MRARYRLRGETDAFLDLVCYEALPHDERWAFISAAREMRDSAWWRSIPTYEQPAPVAGEFEAK